MPQRKQLSTPSLSAAKTLLPAQAPRCLGGQDNPALGFKEKVKQEKKMLVLCTNAVFFKLCSLFFLQYF